MGLFEQDTAVQRISETRWQANLVPGWRIGEMMNGGYLLAIAGRVMGEALPQSDPLSINAFYLAPAFVGPMVCEVEILRLGKNTSQAVVKMYQNDELKVQVTGACCDLDSLSGPTWLRTERPDIPEWEELVPTPNTAIELGQRMDLRLSQGQSFMKDGKGDGRGEFQGWIRHSDGAPTDALSLLFFSDAFPPPAFSLFGAVGWVPTIELTVQVRAKPAPGPIQAYLWSNYLTEGITEEDGLFWDNTGKLVAISRQSAKVRA
jgi:acyl-CoA thioesterase